jgi:hypothetical protein
MSIDTHPLRYAKITKDIERVLYRRSLERRLGGYTLETALEIAECLTGTGVPVDIAPSTPPSAPREKV